MYKFIVLINDKALIYLIDFKFIKINYKINRKKKLSYFIYNFFFI